MKHLTYLLLFLFSCTKHIDQKVTYSWSQYKLLTTIDINTRYPYPVPYVYDFDIYWHNSEYPEHDAIHWPITVPAGLTHYQFRDSTQFVDVFIDSIELVRYRPE